MSCQSHEKVCKNKTVWGILISNENNNTYEFNQYMKSDKKSNITHADIESLIKNIDRCANIQKQFVAIKVGQHIPC